MNLRPDEPPNGDFVAYVESLVNRSSREHAVQRRDVVPPQMHTKSVASSKATKPAAALDKNQAQSAAEALLQTARDATPEQVLAKAKGWMIKAVIGVVALLVVLPMLIDWWDETDDPSSVGIVLVMAAIALRWWLANRRR